MLGSYVSLLLARICFWTNNRGAGGSCHRYSLCHSRQENGMYTEWRGSLLTRFNFEVLWCFLRFHRSCWLTSSGVWVWGVGVWGGGVGLGVLVGGGVKKMRSQVKSSILLIALRPRAPTSVTIQIIVNAYELLNLRALKIICLNKILIFQCMGEIFCVEFQRVPLKFQTKYLTHTLQNENFIHRWKFKSS